MMDMDHLVAPEFYSEARTMARGSHVCCECQRLIAPGDSYMRVAGKWDGDFLAYEFCARCWRLREKIQDKTGYGIGFGCLREAIREEIDNR